MTMTYSWKVTSIKKDPNDSVVQTYWEKKGVDEDGNEGMFAGATPFTADPNAEGYIPFANLTEADVLNWIQAVVVGDYEEHVNSQIQRQIDEKTITEADMPWAEPAENNQEA